MPRLWLSEKAEGDVYLSTSFGSHFLIIIIMESHNIERQGNLTIVHPKNHKHTLIWIHGLNQHQEMHLPNVLNALGEHADTFKILCPRAPDRYVTALDQKVSSWFNLAHRNERNFIVPFDEAFSSAEVIDSHQKVLLPLIEKESKIVHEIGGKLLVCGFSQGCGMSIHCLYNNPELVDAAIGLSGYFFPITKYDPNMKNPLYVIYGLADDLRPWELTKVSYYGRMSEQQVSFVPGAKHEITKETEKVFAALFNQILGVKAKI